MKRITTVLIVVLAVACRDRKEKLLTQSVTVGDNKCIVQRMPAEFNEGENADGRFDYFRVILQSKAKLMDSSHVNYINFGMENAIRMVLNKDTLVPAFVQRIANGKKENYEYMVAFDKNKDEQPFEIVINEQALEIGQVSLKF
jgi:hypothetical protein